jgi:pimeloyl-ACP methyl ester carboxylesterase
MITSLRQRFRVAALRRCAAVALAPVLAFAAAPAARADEFDSGGVKIHYEIVGNGAPVLLIHGLDSSATLNWGVPGIIAELARDHMVVAMDCRGHGQSGKPTAAGSYGLNMVADVLRLMDHLHIAKAPVVGYSMGGMIAMKLAIMHPERVSLAVLGGMGWLRADAPQNRMWEMASEGGRTRVPAACMREFPSLAVTEAEIRASKVPVVMIVGDRDPTRRLYVEPMRALRPDWPVRVIGDAGHMNCCGKKEFREQLSAALAAPAPETK